MILQKFAFILIVIACIFDEVKTHEFGKERGRRSLPLLFPNISAITFICGFGVPVHPLDPELVTMGMVFKAQQLLPATLQALAKFTNHHIERKSIEYSRYTYNVSSNGSRNSKQKEHNERSKHRLYFYKGLEQLSRSLGQEGKICVLKMICEAATVTFHYNNGVLGDLIHILLTPSSSHDFYTSMDYDYVKAEKNGKDGLSCGKLYQGCHETILDRITNIFHHANP